MKRGMRIVFVAPFGIRHKTTVWARIVPLARELNRLGHTTRILVPPWDSPQDAGTHIIKDHVHLQHVQLDNGVAATSLRLLQQVRDLQPDIVHIIKPRAYAGIVQWMLWQMKRAGLCRSQLLLDVDDWERPWSRINHYSQYQSLFLNWQEEWGIRHADGVTAASRWLERNVAAASPRMPILYLPNGVDSVDNEPRDYALHHPPRVLWLTRFVEVSPEWLASCWRSVLQETPNAILYVAGRALYDNGEAAYLNKLAVATYSGQPSNVVWLGYVPPADLPLLFDAIDCAIFPSDNAPLLQAKCSVRFATVLQNGVPSIASAVGEQSRYGADGAAFMVQPDATPERFAAAVTALLHDEERRTAIGAVARSRMRTAYSWEVMGKRLAEFYESNIRTPEAFHG